jgi:uncharacterized membrane protein
MEGEGARREVDDELAALRSRIEELETRLAAIERIPAATAPVTAPHGQPSPRSELPAAAPAGARVPGSLPGSGAAPTAPPAPPAAAAAPQAPGELPSYWYGKTAPASPARQPARWGPAAAEPVVPRAPLSLRDLEERFAGRALAWTGGLALVAASIFFLSLAFSRGWITEPLRVAIGLVVGVGAFGLGGLFLLRRNALLGHVLTAVGLGITSITLMAATRLYNVMWPEVGLLLALVAAVAAATLAVRTGAVVVAAYGLVAALIAPPLVGATPNLVTLGFVAVTLVGTTGVALFRAWRWLPPLAFVLAAPQLASWLAGDPVPAQALIALAGFWLVNTVAAAGEEVRIRRDDLRPSSATLVLANATFLVWGGFVVLAGDLETWRGTFVGLAAVAHVLVGGWFLDRQGLEHLFGNLVAATGIACLALATFVQLGAPVVPVGWAVEAVALGWLAARRLHRWSAVAGLALGGLAVAHLLLLEYPLDGFGLPSGAPFATPFQHPEAGSLAGVLAALAVAAALIRIRWVRSVLAGVGIVLAAYACTFELTGVPLTAALAGLGIAGLLLDRLVARTGSPVHLAPLASRVGFGWIASLGGGIAGLMALADLALVQYPANGPGTLFPTPFQHPEAASLGIVLGALVAAGVLLPARWVRSALAGLGVLLVVYVLPFELTGTELVAGLVVLLPAGILLDRALALPSEDTRFAPLIGLTRFEAWCAVAGAAAWAAAAAYALGAFVQPLRWGLETPPAIPFGDERALVGALLAGSALAAARWLAPMPARRVAVFTALAVAGDVVPFEVYADGVAVLWIGLAGLSILAARWDRAGARILSGLAGLFVAGAAAVSFLIVARPDRLWVVDEAAGRAGLLAGWPFALAAVGLALYAAPRFVSLKRWRTWLELAAGVTGVYLASVAVVDVFQRSVGGAISVEELATQGQVALSVLWTVIGAVGLAVGTTRQRPLLRHAGLGLIGVATAKVFVVDLAAMDVAYRAVVLAALGLLLLASAWLFTRFRGPRAGPTGITGGAPGHA